MKQRSLRVWRKIQRGLVFQRRRMRSNIERPEPTFGGWRGGETTK